MVNVLDLDEITSRINKEHSDFTKENSNPPIRTKVKTNLNNKSILYYEVYDSMHKDVLSGLRNPDNELVTKIKQMINDNPITREEFYKRCIDKKIANANSQIYNLEFGLRQERGITFETALKWAEAYNKVIEIQIF
jgi:hypothetical protein